jgi:hypothetical protein
MFAMKLYTKISLIFLIPIFAGLAGCVKEDQYPVVPHIEFAGYGIYSAADETDSICKISISYTDGDGDIGLTENDSLEPYKYNYFIKLMQLVDGQMTEVVLPDGKSINFNARIPILTPTGRNKNIKGEISMNFDLYFNSYLLKSDTIGFEIYIMDRALNKSNIVTTPNLTIRR